MDNTEIAKQFQEKLKRSLKPQAVGYQLLIMTGISIGTVLLFNTLRPKNKIIYEPKVKYHVGDKEPPRISKSRFGWVSPLLHTKEPELVDKLGLDAATFLRFLHMMRWLFTAIAVLGAASLIPLDLWFNLHYHVESTDILSKISIRDVTGNTLYAHLIASYVFTIIVMGFVFVHWRAMLHLRKAWFRSPDYLESFHARTLIVTRVPKDLQSDAEIEKVFQSVRVPYPTTAVHVGRSVGSLSLIIEEHNNIVRKLEGYLVSYLKDGKIRKKRPTIRLGGFMGMGGNKVDAINHYSAQLALSEARVEKSREGIETHKAKNYGFVSMEAVPYAHVVARTLKGKLLKRMAISIAPNPKDIIWSNITLSPSAVFRREMFGFLILGIVCFFNTIPVLIISFLANLTVVTSFVPFLQDWSDNSPGTFNIVSGILPPIVSGLFSWSLPIIMRKISWYQGGNTQARLDRAVVQRYFFFLVISQLLIFTLCSLGYQIVSAMVQALTQEESKKSKKSLEHVINKIMDIDILKSINIAYISQSNYWLTYFPQRGFLVVFDLAQIINLVVVYIRKRLFGRTPRDIRDWTQPPDFQYAIYYSNMLFMACVALVFAPLVPLVSVAAAIVFWISSWIYKYQLMFVFVTRVETGGRLWNLVINRVLVSTALMQVLLVLSIGLQFGWRSLHWIAALPPIAILLIFKIYIYYAFSNPSRYYRPTKVELSEAKVHSRRADDKGNRLERRFGHPALHAELFTPMLHANMVPLLPQVFSGTIEHQAAKMSEMGGQNVDTTVVQGGINIAGIEESDLEYDPTQYERDQGETDWDARSIASTDILGDSASLAPSKAISHANGRTSPSPSPSLVKSVDRYMARGPGTDDLGGRAWSLGPC